MRDIRLYIADERVDLTEESTFPISFQLEDFNNPTVTKISHSSTISLKGTKQNNKIFGEFWDVTRMQHYDSITGGKQYYGVNFDPSKRVEYKLYVDGELMESGYIQLNDVSSMGEDITYNITLYGGLGDFFYGLKYKDDGEPRTLADLRYFIKDGSAVLPEKDEFTFSINKNLVNECFDKLTWDGDQLTDFLTFVPSYNGTYSNFDSSKCIVNSYNNPYPSLFPSSIEYGGNEYKPVNGYGLASLNKDYNEWEMRDLRSYYQRPALKLSKLMETICRKENSGYEVTFDPTFFNKNNPYWSDTFIALPLLTSLDADAETSTTNDVRVLGEMTLNNADRSFDYNLKINGLSLPSDNEGVITFPDSAVGTTIDLSYDFSLYAGVPYAAEDKLMLWSRRKEGDFYISSPWNISTYLTVEDADTGEVLGYSNGYQFHSFNKLPVDMQGLPSEVTRSAVKGAYYRTGGGYIFKADNGDNTFRCTFGDIPVRGRMVVKIHSFFYPEKDRYQLSIDEPYSSVVYDFAAFIEQVGGEASLTDKQQIASNRVITKKMLLRTENSPCDYLLSFAKIFGLYFIKDINEKKITICSRNTFFTGETIDVDGLIDYSKDVTITPILFDKKFYKLSLPTPDTTYAKKYNDHYEQSYGQKRIYTGYNFSSEFTSLYDNNVFQAVVPILDSSKYYRLYQAGPSFSLDGFSYELYNGDESTTIERVLPVTNSIDFNTTTGGDCWPKCCFFSLDNDNKSLQEISSTILFFNGLKDCQTIDGRPINYWITDDLSIMNKLNDKTPCFIFTNDERDASGQRIAWRRTALPQYIPYLMKGSTVAQSMDFGMPKEVYLNTINYPEVTIYDQFWKAFYNDQFSIDTKKVTCFIRMDEFKQEYLRRFYWFNNGLWLINRVDSFDPANPGVTRVEFIKVQNVTNYTNGQIIN